MNDDGYKSGWKYRDNSTNKSHISSSSASSDKSLSKDQLQKEESKSTLGSRWAVNEMPNLNNSPLFNSSNNKSLMSKLGLGIKSNRNKVLGGGVIGGVAILLFFGFGGIATYELQTISKDMIGYEARSEQYVEKKASQDLLAKVLCWKLGIKCSVIPSNKNPTSSNDNVPEATAAGDGLTEDIAKKFSFTNPEIEQSLANSGYTVQTDSTGNFTGILAPDGSYITPADIQDNTNGVFDSLNTALPEWAVGQLENFRSVMFKYANADFNVLSDKPNDTNVAKEIQSSDSVGATGDVAATEAAAAEQATIEDNSQPLPKDTSPAISSTASTVDSASSTLNTVDQSFTSDVKNGASISAAEQSAASEVEGSLLSKGGGTVASIAQQACVYREVLNGIVKAHIPLILSLLIRNASTTISLASQLTSGHITGQEFGQAMKLFSGNQNPGASSTASLPFSASAGWQNATGGHGGFPISSSSLPTINGIMAGVGTLNSIINKIPGGPTFCSISNNSILGIVVGGAGLALQVVGDSASFGALEIATLSIQGASTAALVAAVPHIVQAMTPVGLMGFQNSVQNMNNTDAGLNISYNNQSRTMGGMPQTSTQSVTNYNKANQNAVSVLNHTSWMNRTFGLSNPNSLVARFAVSIPLNISSMAFDLSNFLATLPSTLIHNFSSIFIFPKALAATQTTYPGQPYNLTQYSISNNNISKYDPIANANYLFSKVSYGGKSASRITMLGNPNSLTPVTGDTNYGDLLHCFIDSYTSIYQGATANGTVTFNPSQPLYLDSGADQNCGALGLYNLSDYNDNGSNGNITALPNDNTVAAIYCGYLTGSESNQTCINTLLNDGQINNDIGHFRQYLLDLNVMNNFTSLTNNK